MAHYSMNIQWSEEDNAFIVSLPEFPEAKTHGSNYQEAVKNGAEILELLIESYQQQGKPLPAPQVLKAA